VWILIDIKTSTKTRARCSRMSDLPELNLFEEIAEIHGLTNSSDFYAYTEDQRFAEDEFNKTWSNYEDETAMDTKDSTWSSPVRSIPTPPSSGKSSPTRDAWDPMLWHTRSMEEVELRSLSELGHVSPPVSSMVMTTVSTNSDVMPVLEYDNSLELTANDISAPDLSSVSGSVTGSNQLALGDKRSRSDQSGCETESRKWLGRGQRTTGRKPSKEESQIVSWRRGIDYPPQKSSFNITSSRSSKKKLYEMRPFADPSKEKERLNAINAKKNRDKKKILMTQSQNEINTLKELNKRLNKNVILQKQKLLLASREIKLLKCKLMSSSPTQAIRSHA